MHHADVCVVWSTCSSRSSFVPGWRLHPSGFISLMPDVFCIIPVFPC